jgi:putative oxidoreductase
MDTLSAAKFDWPEVSMLVGRVCLSALFLFSGVGKLVAPAETVAAIEAVGLPFPIAGLVVAISIELLCGAALMLGRQVRWSAGILAAFAIATAVFFHSEFSDPNQVTHFLKNLALTGGLLHVIVIGTPGTVSNRDP